MSGIRHRNCIPCKIPGRIINEVPGANRVVYDISSKPQATIIWSDQQAATGRERPDRRGVSDPKHTKPLTPHATLILRLIAVQGVPLALLAAGLIQA
ncbi:MAG: hypothetical protein LAT64_08660 [Phycisphaerales bacterium]|nr:hypothetical protein [Phycisphaerales bacterium]